MSSQSFAKQKERYVLDRSRSKLPRGTGRTYEAFSPQRNVTTENEPMPQQQSHYETLVDTDDDDGNNKDEEILLENATATPSNLRRRSGQRLNQKNDVDILQHDSLAYSTLAALTDMHSNAASRRRINTKILYDDTSDSDGGEQNKEYKSIYNDSKEPNNKRNKSTGSTLFNKAPALDDNSLNGEVEQLPDAPATKQRKVKKLNAVLDDTSSDEKQSVERDSSIQLGKSARKRSLPANTQAQYLHKPTRIFDQDLEESSTARAKKILRKASRAKAKNVSSGEKRLKTTRTTRKTSGKDTSDSDNNESSDDSEERKGRFSKARASSRQKKRQRNNDDDDDDESYHDVDDGDSSDEDDVALPHSDESFRPQRVRSPKQGRIRTARKSAPTLPSRLELESLVDDDDECDAGDDKPFRATRSSSKSKRLVNGKAKTPLKGVPQSRNRKHEDHALRATRSTTKGKHHHPEEKSRTRQASTQGSSFQAKRKATNRGGLRKFSPKPRRNVDSDDDFVDDQRDDDNDELESDFLDTESGKSDDELVAFDTKGSSKGKDTKQPRSLKSHPIQKLVSVRGTVDSSSDDDVVDKRRHQDKTGYHEKSHCELHENYKTCPSKEDAITQDLLPSKHVCFIAPDGKSRQCFALETLRKVALTSAIVTYRDTFDGKHNFLQPPHFRDTMSDDLLDQIASRFGRQALDIHGEFYNRSSTTEVGSDANPDDDYVVCFSESHMDDDAFVENFRRYVSKTMGSKDVYACPLCYTEVHRQLTGSDRDKDTANESPSFLDFIQDPMTILGYLDNDSFAMASTFCFSKVSEIKGHLREDHYVDTQTVDGNELYSNFKVRGQGGLLQTYINKLSKNRRPALQGDMMRYWLSGHNQSFLLLLSQMSYREMYWKIMFEDDDEDASQLDNMRVTAFRKKAAVLWDKTKTFFESFQGNVQATWETLSAPFRKVTQEDVEDFISSGRSDEDDNDEADHIALHRSMMQNEEDKLEEKLIEHLRKKHGSNLDSDVGTDDDDDPNLSDDSGDLIDSEDDPTTLHGYYSEVSEQELEDDELGKSQRLRPGRRSVVLSPPSRSTVKRKKLGKGRISTNGSHFSTNLCTPPTVYNLTDESPLAASAPSSSAAKAKRVINDTDEDDLVIVVGDVPSSRSQPTSVAKAKRIVVDSDDESVEIINLKDDPTL